MDGNDVIYGGPGDDSPPWGEGGRGRHLRGGWQRFLGRILGAEFLVAVGDIRAFSSADRLAAYDAGLVPAARDSGKRVGKHRFLGEEGTRP